jgi:hypothetical protein
LIFRKAQFTPLLGIVILSDVFTIRFYLNMLEETFKIL